MKLYLLPFLLLFTGCDAVQEKSGIVLHAATQQPLEGVAISKYEQEDSTKTYTRRIYSGPDGRFNYFSVGMTNAFSLYLMKEGFKTKRVKHNASDTILLEPIKAVQ